MTSKALLSELQSIAKSFEMVKPNIFRFGNRKYNSSMNRSDILADSESLRQSIIADIEYLLYVIYHCRNDLSINIQGHSNRFCYSEIEDFIESLSNANTGGGSWDPGWKIIDIEKNEFVVQKDKLKLWVSENKFISRSGVCELGNVGRIRMVKELRNLIPGFFMAIGDTPEEETAENHERFRIYWNICRPKAPTLMKFVTDGLNKKGIPFRFKILKNLNEYPRADAAVLYLNKRDFNYIKKTISKIYNNVKPFINPQTPLLAKRLGSGIALAEDPTNGGSFGQSRSRILAQALYNAKQKKDLPVYDCLKKISSYFSSLGLDLYHPYLNPGSVDSYGLQLGLTQSKKN